MNSSGICSPVFGLDRKSDKVKRVSVLDVERVERSAGPLWVCETTVSGNKYYPVVELNGTDLSVNFCDNKELTELQKDELWEEVRDYLVDNGCICIGEDGDYYDLNHRSYRIYQLPLNNPNIFRSQNFTPRQDEYVPVYCGWLSELKVRYIDDFQICEEIFTVFNCRRPQHFAGHSLSCSDVVVITYGEGENWVRKAYLCVAHGFEDVTTTFFGEDE